MRNATKHQQGAVLKAVEPLKLLQSYAHVAGVVNRNRYNRCVVVQTTLLEVCGRLPREVDVGQQAALGQHIAKQLEEVVASVRVRRGNNRERKGSWLELFIIIGLYAEE